MRLATLAATTLLACRAGSDESARALDAAPRIEMSAYPKLLNPGDGEGRTFYMGGGEGCHLVATTDPTQISATIDKASEGTTCPPSLLGDPAWRECKWGGIFANADRSECVCSGGKTPAKKVGCPKPRAD